MKKPLLYAIPQFACSIFLLFLTACSSQNSSPSEKETGNTAAGTEVKSSQPGSPLSSVFLDTLFIESYKLISQIDVKKKNKVTFRFYITNQDSLTIHGWTNDKDSTRFNIIPNLKLFNGGKTSFKIGNDTYLGNSVLYNKFIDDIIGKLSSNKHKYIVFIPQDPATNNGQIIYDIHTTDNLNKIAEFAPTNTYTNPSPPRNAN